MQWTLRRFANWLSVALRPNASGATATISLNCLARVALGTNRAISSSATLAFAPIRSTSARFSNSTVPPGHSLAQICCSIRDRERRDTVDGRGRITNKTYEELDEHGIGMPLMAHGMLHLGAVGIGAMLFGNINAMLPSIGAAGTLSVGMI